MIGIRHRSLSAKSLPDLKSEEDLQSKRVEEGGKESENDKEEVGMLLMKKYQDVSRTIFSKEGESIVFISYCR